MLAKGGHRLVFPWRCGGIECDVSCYLFSVRYGQVMACSNRTVSLAMALYRTKPQIAVQILNSAFLRPSSYFLVDYSHDNS